MQGGNKTKDVGFERSQSPILYEEIAGKDGALGLITLNRQNTLNALNHEMFLSLDHHLAKWSTDPAIKAVVIRAAPGRAFCAGGDLRYVYQHKTDPTLKYLFRDEYRLNHRIFHYPKPYIALLDGITMGGGVGISVHGSHRVATERLSFAMPETAIGFFPDVGGSYFLPRLTNGLGNYLGLTGARLNADDCCALGITQYLVNSETLPEIMNALVNAPLIENSYSMVSDVLNRYKITPEKASILDLRIEIEAAFNKKSVVEIMEVLTTATHPWAQETATILQKKSPTSLAVTLAQLQKGSKLEFDECMIMEYRLVNRFLSGHDFFEGIRALIVDKDQTPHWQPGSLAAISSIAIDKYFAPLAEELV